MQYKPSNWASKKNLYPNWLKRYYQNMSTQPTEQEPLAFTETINREMADLEVNVSLMNSRYVTGNLHVLHA
jgi:tRNA threonylcarbamoyladenosine modification (KEOPS) complex Cgi121 subunit